VADIRAWLKPSMNAGKRNTCRLVMLKVERDQWGKQEQARVDADPDRDGFTASIFAADDED